MFNYVYPAFNNDYFSIIELPKSWIDMLRFLIIPVAAEARIYRYN